MESATTLRVRYLFVFVTFSNDAAHVAVYLFSHYLLKLVVATPLQ